MQITTSPAWTAGCSVLTRPPSISGEFVTSETSLLTQQTTPAHNTLHCVRSIHMWWGEGVLQGSTKKPILVWPLLQKLLMHLPRSDAVAFIHNPSWNFFFIIVHCPTANLYHFMTVKSCAFAAIIQIVKKITAPHHITQHVISWPNISSQQQNEQIGYC